MLTKRDVYVCDGERGYFYRSHFAGEAYYEFENVEPETYKGNI